MTVEKVLEIQDLRLSFGGLQALEGLSLDVKAHEILGLIGPNGAVNMPFNYCLKTKAFPALRLLVRC